MAIEKQINIVVKETGLDEVNKKVDKLDNSLSDLEKQQRSLAGSMGESSQSVLDNGGAMGLLNDATGGLAMTVKDAVEASWLFTKSQKAAAIQQAISTTVVGTSTGAMKAFRIALAATGVGLLVIGLGLLVANFDKVKQAVLNLVPGLANIGEFVSNLIDGFTDFIGVTSEAERNMARFTEQADKSLAMNKKFLAEEGDLVNKYTKAKIDAKNAYNEAIKEEGANQTKLAERLNRELLAIDKMHNEDLAKERKDKQDKIDSENKTRAEKEKADRLKAEEEEKKRLEDIAKAKLDADMQSAKDAMAIVDELKKNVETPAKKEQREFEEKKAILEDNNLSTQELERQHIDAMFAISEEDRKKREENDLEYWSGESERAIKQSENDKKLADDKILLEEQVKTAKYDIANQTLALISEVAGKGSKIGKAIAISQTTMSGVEGVQNAFTTAQKSPVTAVFPAYPFVQAGLAGAFSAIQIAKIAKGDKASSGSSVGGGGGSAPQAPSFNIVQGTRTNQVAESISKQAPVKAFVVSKDMTTGQEMDRNIVTSASL